MKSVLFFLEDMDLSPEGLVSPVSKIRRISISCRSLGVKELILVDLTKFKVGQYYTHSSESFYFRYYKNFVESLYDFSDREIIILDTYENITKHERSAESLLNSKSNGNALYVVGPDNGSFFNTIDFGSIQKSVPHISWVFIPCKEPNVLYAEHTLVIALYEHERAK